MSAPVVSEAPAVNGTAGDGSVMSAPVVGEAPAVNEAPEAEAS